MDEDTRKAFESYFKMKASQDQKRKSKSRSAPKVRFSRRGDLLVAKCPSGECTVDIEIQRGEYGDVRKQVPALQREMEKANRDIIRAKLDIVFGLATKEEGMAAFQDARSRGQEAKNRANYARIKAAGRKSTGDLNGPIARASTLVNDINSAIGAGDARSAVQIYTDSLVPELQTIRDLKYGVNRTVFDSRSLTTYLIQEPKPFSSFIQPISQADKARVLVDIK